MSVFQILLIIAAIFMVGMIILNFVVNRRK